MNGKNLATLRKRKGITQEKLAYMLSVHELTISRWERGISEPDASLVIKLCEILDVSESELLHGPDEGLKEFKLILDKDGECNLDVMNISANAPEEKVMLVSADRIAIKTNMKTTGMTREEAYQACMKDFNETFNDAWDQQEKWRSRKARN